MIHHRARLIVLLTLGLVAGSQVQPGQSRGLLGGVLPGVGLLRELSAGVADTLGGALERGYQAFQGQLGAGRQLADECLDELQCLAGAERDPDAKRNVVEIIRSRGFQAEEFEVVTRDGYILSIQRIVNPLVEAAARGKLKPVLLQHGLMSSSVDWVINSVNVKPSKYPAAKAEAELDNDQSANTIEAHQLRQAAAANESGGSLGGDSQEHPNSLGFYLANQGYDVFLGNSRGNIYGQRHRNLSSWNPKFWDFTFDEQIKFDLPDTLEFIQKLTNHSKVGYVGHSQGTTMAFGLLADRPEFADILEPVVALAPVAFVSQCLSPVRHFAPYTPLFQHLNMWFGSSNAVVRYLGPIVCGPQVVRRDICANIVFLSTGFDEAEFDQSRVSAFLAHMPSGTSVKNVAHWGQMVNSGRFAHFEHGILANQVAYGASEAPDYELARIRSQSISLFTAENDWLASPGDVARLKASLKVPLFRVVNVTEDKPKWNHIDFVYGRDAGQLINRRIIEIFDHFRQ